MAEEFDPSHLAVEKVVAFGVARVKARIIRTPEGAVAGRRAVVLEGARQRRHLVARRDAEICRKKKEPTDRSINGRKKTDLLTDLPFYWDNPFVNTFTELFFTRLPTFLLSSQM